MQIADKVHHAFAHQGLAPGDPDLANALGHRHPDQVQHFFVPQDLRGRQFDPFLRRGAVETAEVAAVGNGQS